MTLKALIKQYQEDRETKDTYIQYFHLKKATTGHLYTIDYYTNKGELIGETDISLSELDSYTKQGQRIRLSGHQWGRLSLSGVVFAVPTPAFLNK